jgi:hypothetical protein
LFDLNAAVFRTGRFYRADGTFDADITYRIEVGQISIDPAPPAFSGSVTGSGLILKECAVG